MHPSLSMKHLYAAFAENHSCSVTSCYEDVVRCDTSAGRDVFGPTSSGERGTASSPPRKQPRAGTPDTSPESSVDENVADGGSANANDGSRGRSLPGLIDDEHVPRSLNALAISQTSSTMSGEGVRSSDSPVSTAPYHHFSATAAVAAVGGDGLSGCRLSRCPSDESSLEPSNYDNDVMCAYGGQGNQTETGTTVSGNGSNSTLATSNMFSKEDLDAITPLQITTYLTVEERKKIGTKVLASKLRGGGYVLAFSGRVVCDSCNLPLVSTSDGGPVEACVICPLLKKKVLKKILEGVTEPPSGTGHGPYVPVVPVAERHSNVAFVTIPAQQGVNVNCPMDNDSLFGDAKSYYNGLRSSLASFDCQQYDSGMDTIEYARVELAKKKVQLSQILKDSGVKCHESDFEEYNKAVALAGEMVVHRVALVPDALQYRENNAAANDWRGLADAWNKNIACLRIMECNDRTDMAEVGDTIENGNCGLTRDIGALLEQDVKDRESNPVANKEWRSLAEAWNKNLAYLRAIKCMDANDPAGGDASVNGGGNLARGIGALLDQDDEKALEQRNPIANDWRDLAEAWNKKMACLPHFDECKDWNDSSGSDVVEMRNGGLTHNIGALLDQDKILVEDASDDAEDMVGLNHKEVVSVESWHWRAASQEYDREEKFEDHEWWWHGKRSHVPRRRTSGQLG